MFFDFLQTMSDGTGRIRLSRMDRKKAEAASTTEDLSDLSGLIDLHCHILPGMDDGARDEQESMDLLTSMYEQGVRTVAATSHFYATKENPDKFLKRRQDAFDKIEKLVSDSGLDIRLGAEVKYYTGICNTDLSRLLIQGTDILLLEMPFSKWNPRMIYDIHTLNDRYQVVLAHIERYFTWQKDDVWEELARAGVLFQINADSLLDRHSAKKILKMIKNQKISFIASDAHRTDTRPVRLIDGYTVITDKLSEDDLNYLLKRSRKVFQNSEYRARSKR